jgi:parvulin-like peptidyl-prolyl isomerase
MRSCSLLVIALLATIPLSGCDTETSTKNGTSTEISAQADIGETIATVNGIPIGSKEFEQAAARKTPADGKALSMAEKKEVLDLLIEEKLLYAEALKKGIDKDPKVQKVMVNTLLREDVYSTVKNADFTDEMLQAYYDEHKSDFIVPEKVQIKRILIKVTDARPDAQAKAEAEKVRAEVAAKPDAFKDVAARVSEDPYKRRGGDIGFVSKEGKPGLDPMIVERAFALETGAISDVFKTADGYNIVQAAVRREQVERTFQQMKGSVLRKVKNDKMKQLYDDYVAKIRQGADIKIDESKLAALDIKSNPRAAVPNGVPGMEEGEEGEEGMEGAEGLPGGLPMPNGPGMRPGAEGAPAGARPGPEGGIKMGEGASQSGPGGGPEGPKGAKAEKNNH